MIQVFAGEDTFESYRHAKEALANLSAANGFPIEILNADEISDIDTFLGYIEGVGMFSESSNVLAKRLLNNKKLSEYFTENFDKLNQYQIVIWQDGKLDSRLKITKLLQSKKQLSNFDLPKEGEVKNWTGALAKKKGFVLSPTQVTFIVERIGIDKWAISNELEKIALFLEWKKKQNISEKELEEVLGYNVRGDMWKFLDAVGNKNKEVALHEFAKLTAFEDNGQLLIAMIARELRLIARVLWARKLGAELSSLKLAPFILQKTAQKAKLFSIDEIKEKITALFELDNNIKSGLVNENIGIDLFLASL